MANVYNSALDYMCENYDYSLYATDLSSKEILKLQNTIASVSSTPGKSRISAIKLALHDFFDAIYQKIFVYEDEDRLKIVKYFDKGALSEDQDKQIHGFKQELLQYKVEVENSCKKNHLYMFNKASRKRFETALLFLGANLEKEIMREQINKVYDLEERDIVVFLNGKIFLKKFNYITNRPLIIEDKLEIFYDKRVLESLWVEIKNKLNDSFLANFDFLTYNAQSFYKKYPKSFFAIIKQVVKNTFINVDDEEIIQYTNEVFKTYLPKMLEETVHFVFKQVIESELKAIQFLKQYSESKNVINNKVKFKQLPIMNENGKIYKYQNIFALLKEKELLFSKITHKKIELSNIQEKVKKSLFKVQRSEDEQQLIQNRRHELLVAIEKVDDEIIVVMQKYKKQNLDIDRLEFAKRELLEEFKQVEVRLRTQKNIVKNSQTELNMWEEKRHQKNIAKSELDQMHIKIMQEYNKLSKIFAITLGKEPLEF